MRLSYLSFACPITGHPLEESGGGRGGSQMGAAEDEVHVGNVEQYLCAVVKFWFHDGIQPQLQGFREGLSEVGLRGCLCLPRHSTYSNPSYMYSRATL